MASSSSSPQLIPTVSFKSWNYDVFISFRGEDTRKTFVDHLYTALVKQGIHTYKDDVTLDRGKTVGPSLVKAIRESRIAVVIFSENYANSSWCLDELAHIMETKDQKGQVVLPVFYDVDPSDIRKQSGKYGEAFAKHEMENSNKVESWRKALVRGGNLSGWVPKDIANGHEAKCIEEIVRKISSRLSLFFSDIDKDPIGIDTRFEDLKSNLKIGSDGVRFVGILGVGGSGKTTLASFTYKKISQYFEAHCFLENIRDESSKFGLKKLQEKLLTLILKTKVKLDSEENGKNMIKARLGNKNVLIILDDVDDLQQLEALAGSHDWFGTGSRIIVTTRDEHMLSRKEHKEYEIYGVSLLSPDEAIELFRRHAYREDKPIEDYDSLSLHVVSYAGGLPLALEVLGSFLYDKDLNEWNSALAKLRDIPNPKIMDKLKISFDGLQFDEKELFLDIACFFRKWRLDWAKMVLDACDFHTVIGVKVLVQKSLINVSNGIIDMHDLIEELAHYIVKGEPLKHPETLSRVWRVEDVLDICSSTDTTMENDETEVLVLPPRLPKHVSDITFWPFDYPSSFPSHVSNPRLPRVVAKMKKLRWIYWERYPEYSLPSNFQPRNLRCLMLIMGKQKELWKGCKRLPNLKILDLSYSKSLKKTPDFTGLPLLERLNLNACRKLKDIHSSIGYHERLVFISMTGCWNVKIFPPIIRMKRLETLMLSFCYKLQKFPDIQTNMERLEKLCLDKSGIEIVPASVGQFCTNLVTFDIRRCDKLKRIEGNFRSLKRLKYLYLVGCSQLENLAENFFDVECCLEVLSLPTKSQDSGTFNSLMNGIKSYIFHQDISMSMKFPKLPRFLRELNLNDSDLEDGDIPSDICELLNLQTLNLSGNNFTRLDSILSQIPCLKKLDLSDCYYLLELPDLPPSISILNASSCDSLESVGDLSKYNSLWKVNLWRERKLIGGERIIRSLLQGNAAKDHFISVRLPGGPQVTNEFPYRMTYTLQLPHNWHNDFSGFLICADNIDHIEFIIDIHTEEEKSISTASITDHWEEFDKNPKSYDYAQVGYVPFVSLQNTRWWNSEYTKITFHIERIANPKIALVPRKGVSDSVENEKCVEYIDPTETFSIKDDTKSSVMIKWYHGFVGSDFLPTKMQEMDGEAELPIIGDEFHDFFDRSLINMAKSFKKDKLAEIKKRSKIKRA